MALIVVLIGVLGLSCRVSLAESGARGQVGNACTERDIEVFVAAVTLDQESSAMLYAAYFEYRDGLIRVEQKISEWNSHPLEDEIKSLSEELMPAPSPINIVIKDDNSVEDRGTRGNWAPLDDSRWELLRTYRAEFQNRDVKAAREHDLLIKTLLSQLQEVLDTQGYVEHTAAQYILSRIKQRKPKGIPHDDEYTHIDINELCDSSLHSGVLSGLEPSGGVETERDRWVDLLYDIELLLVAYRHELGANLYQTLFPHREHIRPQDVVFSRPLDESYNKMFLKGGKRWRARSDIDRRCVSAISALVREYSGDLAADAWKREYQARVCPDLYRVRWPHNMVQWASTQKDISPEQLDVVRLVHGDYVRGFDMYTDRAFELGVRACRQSGLIVLSLVGKDAQHRKYQESLCDIHAHSRTMIKRLMAILSPEQRRVLIRELQGNARRSQNSKWGPLIHTQYIDATKAEILSDWIVMLESGK